MGYGYFEYVPVSEKIARAKAALDKLRKKMPDIKPITISGRKLARTWWGEAWNSNLESYRDYAYRLERGRGYVRHGCILHLVVNSGHIEALVQGSRQKPYEIKISIDPLSEKVWNAITQTCKGQIGSMQELLIGKFPKALSELFTQKGNGLFPSPKEIKLSCSCPDYASMCKHVSAVMYGIGARLDEDPSLFFLLRNVNISDLISEAITQKSDELLTKAGRKSRRAIASDDLSAMFGIELESDENIKTVELAAKKTADSVVPVSGTGKRRGRPPKSEAAIVPVVKPVTDTGKRRGRPPKA